MSLVGSLEDLGLADILQIVSLSRKSGVLRLRSDGGEGRIVLRDGLVCAALIKGAPEDLRTLLAAGGEASESELDAAEDFAAKSGISFAEALCARSSLDPARLESVRREHAESCALRMFGWLYGEFSFEVGAEVDPREGALLAAQGLSVQYLAMEATRSEGDALAAAAAQSEGELGDGPWFSGEGEDADAAPGSAAAPDASAARATAAGRAAAADPEVPGAAAPLVVLDSELPALEWIKHTLSGRFSRIHIFQSSDAAIARVRYYLGRGELPVVLLSALPEAAASAAGPAQLGQRLRSLAARMPIVMLCDAASLALVQRSAGAELADAFALRPATPQLANRASWPKHAEAAARLFETLLPWSHPAQRSPQRAARPGAMPATAPAALQPLRIASRRVRDAESVGEVLAALLDFAALHFSRVALFALREGRARGVAGRGLERCGGPDDARLREVDLEIGPCAWFQRAAQVRHPTIAPPLNDGDRSLARRLGTELPDQAYAAPIESGGEVTAILYGDRLPEGGPLGDLTALEILIHQACVALERAVFSRALAPSSSPPARR